jgi:hypothetical protein
MFEVLTLTLSTATTDPGSVVPGKPLRVFRIQSDRDNHKIDQHKAALRKETAFVEYPNAVLVLQTASSPFIGY